MPGFQVSSHFRGPARRFYEQASADVQRRLDAIFDAIENDPTIDNVTKFVFPFPPAICIAYVDDEFQIIYHVTMTPGVGGAVDYWAIGKPGDRPVLR